MHLIKGADAVKRMFCHGQLSAIDAEARYTYSLSATCSKCGAQAFVTRYEQSGPSLNRAVFKCSSCFNQFEPGIDDILLM